MKIIRKAKQIYYIELLVSSSNKSKTSWNIIKSETCKMNTRIHTLSEFELGNKFIHKDQSAEAFNNFFLNVVEELNIEKAILSWLVFYSINHFVMVFLK
jgi:hypothetical protein